MQILLVLNSYEEFSGTNLITVKSAGKLVFIEQK